jgi:SAM-dependent methyltransferase
MCMNVLPGGYDKNPLPPPIASPNVDRLAEQKDYYRHRAPEYDEWWQRLGAYALEQPARDRWFADVHEAEQALDDFAPAGDVLEYAAGTGWWTRRLTRHAGHVTAVDAAPETLHLNRQRSGDHGNVTYLQADIFTWTPPPAAFDVVFFGYWLSHVPEEQLDRFWQQLATALRPAGRIFLLDSYQPARIQGDLQQRVLNDGRRFQIVKRYWQPDELTAYAATQGFRLDARITTNGYVLHATARR